MLDNVGGAVSLRRNTWWTGIMDYSTAIDMVVRSTEGPTIHNETISGPSIGITVSSSWATVQFRDLNITHVSTGLVCYSADVHRTYIRADEFDIRVKGGTVRLYDCDHDYRSIVTDSYGEIIEVNRIMVDSVLWQDGSAVPPGFVDLIGYGITSLANLTAPGPSLVNLTSWYLTDTKTIWYKDFRAKYTIGISDFHSREYPTKPSRNLTLVILDDSPPVVTILEPMRVSPVTGAPLEIMAEVEDVGTGIDEVLARVDDGPWVSASGFTASLFSASISVPEDGVHTVGVLAVDNCGNKGRKSLTVTIDSTRPVISIDHVDRLTNDRDAKLVIRTEPDATVDVNEVDAPASGPGVFIFEVVLVEGENWFQVNVTDAAGNRNDTRPKPSARIKLQAIQNRICDLPVSSDLNGL